MDSTKSGMRPSASGPVHSSGPIAWRVGALAIFLVIATLIATPAFAQNVVQYTGSLMIGFSDADNPDPTNDAVPICAATNPFIKQTFGSLPVNGFAVQPGAGGPGSPLTFGGNYFGLPGVSSVNANLAGGSDIKTTGTCQLALPPFIDPRLRSRTQIGEARWPGMKGPFTAIGQAPGATQPTYMVGPGGGHASLPAGQNDIAIPFYDGNGFDRITKGPATFGGAIPYSGGGGVQLGINTTTLTPGGNQPLATFGVASYINGFLPTDPQLFGTDAKGVSLNPSGLVPAPTTAFANGLIVGRPSDLRLRTPGGPAGTSGVTASIPVAPGVSFPGVSTFQFNGAFFEWTTGMVRHEDNVGDSQTIRSATGGDVAATGPNGTTRSLQLVSPWSATIKAVGAFSSPAGGFQGSVPNLGFGGLAVLDLDIRPVPEPGSIAMIGFGVAGLLGLRAVRRRQD
ncbi:MAG: PEP-CTERM sorting domain-containing protein [bacterium]